MGQHVLPVEICRRCLHHIAAGALISYNSIFARLHFVLPAKNRLQKIFKYTRETLDEETDNPNC